MNPNEHSENDPRAVSLHTVVSSPGLGGVRATSKVRDPDSPSAIEAPAEVKNLVIGVSLLVLAVIVFWMGLYLAGHVAALTLVASFGTFGLLWVLYRFRVLRQPHGPVLAIGSVALFAATLPFIGRGLQKLDSAARTHLAGEPNPASAEKFAAPLPVAPPDHIAKAELPAPPVTPPAPSVDDVVRELIAPPPDPTAGKLIRLKQDAQVVISGRKFLLHGGDQFSFRKFADGMVTFLAGDQEVSVDAGLVTFTGQSQETPEEIKKLAQQELKKRYPAIFEKGSPQNEVFVGRTKELEVELPDFFKNPQWPLELGEQLAAQEGWQRADKSPDEKEPELPKEATPPAPPQEAPN